MRPSSRFGLLALATLICALAAAEPARAASQSAKVSANVVKPLSITWVQDLNLGSITLGPGTWTNATVRITRAGVFSCAAANVACAGPTAVARYNVTGSNNQTVRISAPNVTLVNQSDSTKTLLLTVDSPGTCRHPQLGEPGHQLLARRRDHAQFDHRERRVSRHVQRHGRLLSATSADIRAVQPAWLTENQPFRINTEAIAP